MDTTVMFSIAYTNAEKALLIDSRNYAMRGTITDTADYIERNRYNYYAAVISYCGICSDITPHWKKLIDYIGQIGLTAYAGRCADLYDNFLKNSLDKAPNSVVRNCVLSLVDECIDDLKDLAVVLRISTLLRYLKRFAPIGVSVNPEACVQKFVDNQERLENNFSCVDLMQYAPSLVLAVERHFEKLTDGLDGLITVALRALDDARLPFDVVSLPNGADMEGHPTPASKFLDVCAHYTNPVQVWNTRVPARPKNEEEFIAIIPDGDGEVVCEYSSKYSHGRVVPKDWSRSRFIGIERCHKTVAMQLIAKEFLRKIRTRSHGAINLDDNTNNRMLCADGAYLGNLATIDITDASDSVAVGLMDIICDVNLRKLFDRFRSNFVKLPNGKWCKLATFTTMGSRLTCPLQSSVYFSVILATDDQMQAEGFPKLDLSKVAVYNDDIVVPTYLAQRLCDNLELLGFKINHKKTYLSKDYCQTPFLARYRESCGVEAFRCNELFISFEGLYYPRGGIVTGMKGVQGVIQLEHTMVTYTHDNKLLFPTAVELLCHLVKRLLPEITESEIGSPYDDLWVSVPAFTYRPLQAIDDASGKLVDTDHLCDVHTSFRPSYTERKPTRNELEAAAVMRYVEFLQHGPSYDSELDETLGVSSPRTTQPLTREVDERNAEVRLV